MGSVVSSIFGGGSKQEAPATPATPAPEAPPPPDYGELWGNYRQWTGEAKGRYDTDMTRLRTLTGTSAATREAAIAEREGEFKKEMSGFEQGATGQTLLKNWQEQGGQGSMEEFYGNQFGGYEAPSSGAPGGGAGRAAAASMNPMGSDAAPVAGLGEQRQWWAL